MSSGTTNQDDDPHQDDQAQPDDTAVTVDARGLRCPMPVIRLAQAARAAPAGTVITLFSTDPAAEPDVAAWCRMRGHELVEQTWLDDVPPAPNNIPPDPPALPNPLTPLTAAPRVLRSRIKIHPPNPS